MKNLTITEIAKAVNGEIINCKEPDKIYISEVSTDSRGNLNNTLFFALRGKRVDGHDFIDKAVENGAVCCISEKNKDNPIIKVESSFKALRDLAEYYLSKLNIKVVGITGSIGKTTTKDMIASVLAQKYSVLKTEGNFNNEIGLPLTIFKIEDFHEYAVLEMGMNQFNEINNLSKIAKPDICVITNIGISHIENLGSREGILKAKTEMFNHMKPDGTIILNAEDDMLSTLKDKNNVYYYGTSENQDFYVNEIIENGIESLSCKMHYNYPKGTKGDFSVHIPFPGKHMAKNAAAAVVTGFIAGLKAAEIKNGLENFKLSKMRNEIIKTKTKLTIIDDVYNASPDSVKSAIDILSNANDRKVCILGDMFELGDFSKKAHEDTGEHAVKSKIDVLIFIGEKSKFSYESALKHRKENIYYFTTKEEMLKDKENIICENDTILVKASRGMGFEDIVKSFKGE